MLRSRNGHSAGYATCTGCRTRPPECLQARRRTCSRERMPGADHRRAARWTRSSPPLRSPTRLTVWTQGQRLRRSGRSSLSRRCGYRATAWRAGVAGNGGGSLRRRGGGRGGSQSIGHHLPMPADDPQTTAFVRTLRVRYAVRHGGHAFNGRSTSPGSTSPRTPSCGARPSGHLEEFVASGFEFARRRARPSAPISPARRTSTARSRSRRGGREALQQLFDDDAGIKLRRGEELALPSARCGTVCVDAPRSCARRRGRRRCGPPSRRSSSPG